jgi:hypothetical protein
MDGSRVARTGLTRLIGLIGIVGGACYDPHPPEGAPCTGPDECVSPQRCVVGRCSTHDAGIRDAPIVIVDDAPPIDAPPIDVALDAPLPCEAAGLACGAAVKVVVCGGLCWARCDGARTPDNAQLVCNSWGGSLSEIHDLSGQMCAHDLAIADRTTFGLRQQDDAIARGDGWSWNPVAPNPGAPVTFTNWNTGRPDDGNDNTENHGEQCAHIERNGFWDDAPCGDTHPFLCSRHL